MKKKHTSSATHKSDLRQPSHIFTLSRRNFLFTGTLVMKQTHWDSRFLTLLPKKKQCAWSTAGVWTHRKEKGVEKCLFPPSPFGAFYPTSKTLQLCSSQVHNSTGNGFQPAGDTRQPGWPQKQLGSTRVTLYRLNPATWIAWGGDGQ